MSFAKDVQDFIEFAEEQSEEETRAIALQLFKGVIRDTPVKEGRLKGNWIATINSPSNASTLDKDKTKSGGPTISKASKVVLRMKGDESIYLTNNLEYAGYVEFGTPNQEARRMVGKNVKRVYENANRGKV